MDQRRTLKKVYDSKSERSRTKRRPRLRWWKVFGERSEEDEG